MVNHSCLLFKNPRPWIVFLASFLIFMGVLGSGYLFSIFLTSTVLILSTFFLALLSKQKSVLVENLYESKSPQHENEINTNETTDHDHQEGTSTSSSGMSERDNQCLDQLSTSEDSEADWLFGDSLGHDDDDRSPDYSDGSISDEDSLIEIALPSGHYVGHDHHHCREEIATFSSAALQQKVPDLLPADSIFKQRSLIELLAEINEMNEGD